MLTVSTNFTTEASYILHMMLDFKQQTLVFILDLEYTSIILELSTAGNDFYPYLLLGFLLWDKSSLNYSCITGQV